MAQYVPAFDPRFLGLRPADEAALKKVTKDFKVYYAKVPGTSPENYTVDHSPAATCSTRTVSCACSCATARAPSRSRMTSRR